MNLQSDFQQLKRDTESLNNRLVNVESMLKQIIEMHSKQKNVLQNLMTETDFIKEEDRKLTDTIFPPIVNKQQQKEVSRDNLNYFSSSAQGKSRYWQPEEHVKYLEATHLYGIKEVQKISQYVSTRSNEQVRTHTQKYLLRLQNARDQAQKLTIEHLAKLNFMMNSCQSDSEFATLAKQLQCSNKLQSILELRITQIDCQLLNKACYQLNLENKTSFDFGQGQFDEIGNWGKEFITKQKFQHQPDYEQIKQNLDIFLLKFANKFGIERLGYYMYFLQALVSGQDPQFFILKEFTEVAQSQAAIFMVAFLL